MDLKVDRIEEKKTCKRFTPPGTGTGFIVHSVKSTSDDTISASSKVIASTRPVSGEHSQQQPRLVGDAGLRNLPNPLTSVKCAELANDGTSDERSDMPLLAMDDDVSMYRRTSWLERSRAMLVDMWWMPVS